MSSLAPENVLASQKAGVDTTFGFAAQAVEGFEKLIDLNVRTLRTVLDEHQALVARSLSVRDPQEFLALQNQHLQDSAQRVQAYWTNVYEIASGVRGGCMEAVQDQIEKSQRNVHAFVESLASNAPVGSEAVVTAWKSAIDVATESANSAYEAAKRAARQVVEAAQNDAVVASRTAVRAASPKTASAKK
ncbi:TIGR01841 family phasin [Caballeronia ptereochthonis]|uniref:Phasin family protein n=1 Tax=Caballeronia ptereochthonis TaxID=1777144 RepID=A0A157ZQW1_9BURK|nr:TIGR01841 family phasin [Caballeronia ptereochthonis]SAK47893.1 phasin family protein [Caballeronia ptereochthonis]